MTTNTNDPKSTQTNKPSKRRKLQPRAAIRAGVATEPCTH
jgi:hypothetical protein